jgi:hypothetical protein
MNLLDTTLILYVATACLSSFGFFFYLWWWMKNDGASTMYKYITYLLGGIALNQWGNVVARVGTLADDHTILYTWWWPWRQLIVLVCVFAVVRYGVVRVRR